MVVKFWQATVHLIASAKNYGTLINTACGAKEAMHGLFKAFVPPAYKQKEY
ncbi:MAG TPA: hypothetical protein VFV08_03920 [Puia sp.]|nr:hypothetical protein [Puia sp.]